MVDGASLLATMFSGMLAAGRGATSAATNVLDSGAPWYDTYETQRRQARRDRRDRAEVLRRAARRASASTDGRCRDAARPRTLAGAARALRRALSRRRRATSGARVFEGSDACFAPVLTFAEARSHPHVAARAGARRGRRRRRSLRRRRASRARRAPPEARRRSAAAAAPMPCATGASTRTRSTRCARSALASASASSARSARHAPAASSSDQRPADSAARPSSRSFSRCALSERSATGCRCLGVSA